MGYAVKQEHLSQRKDYVLCHMQHCVLMQKRNRSKGTAEKNGEPSERDGFLYYRMFEMDCNKQIPVNT